MNIAEEIGKSVWKEVGKTALKRGIGTLVGESVKAVIEVVKKRQLRKDQYDFQQWKKEKAVAERQDKEAEMEVEEKTEEDETPEAEASEVI